MNSDETDIKTRQCSLVRVLVHFTLMSEVPQYNGHISWNVLLQLSSLLEISFT